MRSKTAHPERVLTLLAVTSLAGCALVEGFLEGSAEERLVVSRRDDMGRARQGFRGRRSRSGHGGNHVRDRRARLARHGTGRRGVRMGLRSREGGSIRRSRRRGLLGVAGKYCTGARPPLADPSGSDEPRPGRLGRGIRRPGGPLRTRGSGGPKHDRPGRLSPRGRGRVRGVAHRDRDASDEGHPRRAQDRVRRHDRSRSTRALVHGQRRRSIRATEHTTRVRRRGPRARLRRGMTDAEGYRDPLCRGAGPNPVTC